MFFYVFWVFLVERSDGLLIIILAYDILIRPFAMVSLRQLSQPNSISGLTEARRQNMTWWKYVSRERGQNAFSCSSFMKNDRNISEQWVKQRVLCVNTILWRVELTHNVYIKYSTDKWDGGSFYMPIFIYMGGNLQFSIWRYIFNDDLCLVSGKNFSVS
jgi:hypothetical protein